MTDNQLSIRTTTADMLAKIDSAELQNEANRIMKFGPFPNINAAQAAQLVMYARMIDANPWNGEVYPTSQGPMNGVMLYRRKAKEYNQRMSPDGEDWDYKVNYRLAESHEADFDPNNGDVAWVCELTDTKAEKEWQAAYVKIFNLLREGDDPAPYKFADERAMMIAGPRPVWSAVGVVGGSERFTKPEYENNKIKTDASGDVVYKQEMWDRNERAKKRAEKLVLKKRYPDMLIPEYHQVCSPDVEIKISNAVGEMEKATPVISKRRAAQNMRDLGFEPDESMIEEGEYTDVEPPADPNWNPEENADDIFATVTDSKGTPYKDKDESSLSFSLRALNKKIAAMGEPTNEEELNKLTELTLKRDAVEHYINNAA